MMDTLQDAYSLFQVLASAKCHPFYSSEHKFPPSKQDYTYIAATNGGESLSLKALDAFTLLEKDTLYQAIERLCEENDPLNTFKHGTYVSSTGGGSGLSMPMMFLTDARENRHQRLATGKLAERCGVIDEKDWVVTVHPSGQLYRSLDLLAELIENAGGSVLCAGADMTHYQVEKLYQAYKPNVYCGDSSKIMEFATYIASLEANETNMRHEPSVPVRFDKILYTSEPLTAAQRRYVTSVFRKDNAKLQFISFFASAESGPWCVGNADLTEPVTDVAADFIFDTRHMIVEIQPLDTSDDYAPLCPTKSTLPTGQIGSIVITSLQRLRHPLVRYMTGDIGSLHELPRSARESIKGDSDTLRVIRLHGRDVRQSFKWQAEYFELKMIAEIMQTPEWAVLKWQVVTGIADVPAQTHYLEVRLLRERRAAGDGREMVSDEELRQLLATAFLVPEQAEHLFRVVHVTDTNAFERSRTGRKVIKFVDKR